MNSKLWKKVNQHREEIIRLAQRRGATNVRLFGSLARGEADDSSDVDILVDLEPGRGLLDLGGLLMDLRELLGERVDVATPNLLKQRVRSRAMSEARPL